MSYKDYTTISNIRDPHGYQLFWEWFPQRLFIKHCGTRSKLS
jgi:hypothetical protein